MPLEKFTKWGVVDFVQPIKFRLQTIRCEYIIVATYYYTKWPQTMALWTNIAEDVESFIYRNIMTKFGCSIELVIDQGKHFMNEVI